MAALIHEPIDQPNATTARYRKAAEASDIEGLIATLTPDVVLRSPITDRKAFRGREEVRELLHSVFATISDIRYFADVGDERTRVVFDRATVEGQPLEQATRLELDDQGQIKEITLFFRPLPGLATLTAALGPRVAARRHGNSRSLIARLLLWPLALATRFGDRFVSWFT